MGTISAWDVHASGLFTAQLKNCGDGGARLYASFVWVFSKGVTYCCFSWIDSRIVFNLYNCTLICYLIGSIGWGFLISGIGKDRVMNNSCGIYYGIG